MLARRRFPQFPHTLPQLNFARGNVESVARSALSFIRRLFKDLQHQQNVDRGKAAGWAYSTSRALLHSCRSSPNQMSANLSHLLGDLSVLALSKLEDLGKARRFIPPQVELFPCLTFDGTPSGVQSPPLTPKGSAPSGNISQLDISTISNRNLRNALENEATFDEHYTRLASEATKEYSHALRYRSVVRINGELASLHLYV